jgi:hypothetical protein
MSLGHRLFRGHKQGGTPDYCRPGPLPGRPQPIKIEIARKLGLAAYAGSVRWTRATPNEWLTTAALSFIGAGIILHVGIGLRWPFAHKTMEENP